MWRQRDLGVGISCILSPGTFPSDLTKKDSRSTDLRNVWSLAHRTVPPQNAPRIVDRLNEFGLEPFDGW